MFISTIIRSPKTQIISVLDLRFINFKTALVRLNFFCFVCLDSLLLQVNVFPAMTILCRRYIDILSLYEMQNVMSDRTIFMSLLQFQGISFKFALISMYCTVFIFRFLLVINTISVSAYLFFRISTFGLVCSKTSLVQDFVHPSCVQTF